MARAAKRSRRASSPPRAAGARMAGACASPAPGRQCREEAGETNRQALHPPPLQPDVGGRGDRHQHQRPSASGEAKRTAAPACRRKPVSSRSQSPCVCSTTWRAPAEVISAATSWRSYAAARSKRARSASLDVSTLGCRPVSGSRSRRAPKASAAPSRARRGLDRHDMMAPAEREQRAAPVARPAEVGERRARAARAMLPTRRIASPIEGAPRPPCADRAASSLQGEQQRRAGPPDPGARAACADGRRRT